jgi:hypothetical protein
VAADEVGCVADALPGWRPAKVGAEPGHPEREQLVGLRADSPRLAALRAAVERRVDPDGLVRLRSYRSGTAVMTWAPPG